MIEKENINLKQNIKDFFYDFAKFFSKYRGYATTINGGDIQILIMTEIGAYECIRIIESYSGSGTLFEVKGKGYLATYDSLTHEFKIIPDDKRLQKRKEGREEAFNKNTMEEFRYINL